MRLKILVLAVLITAFLANCIQSEQKEGIIVGEPWDITGVDPVTERGAVFMAVKGHVLETLVLAEPNLTLKPWLAESWSQIDEKTWIFKLRKGVKFHDGKEMKASDVKWSIERALAKNPAIKQLTSIESVEVVDDYTLKFVTQKPYAAFPASLSYFQLGILSPKSEVTQEVVVHPIGTGPFKFVSWNQSEKTLYLERFDDYWGEKAKLKLWTIKVITDPAARSLAVESGEVDLTYDVLDFERLSKVNGLKVEIFSAYRDYELRFGSVKDSIYSDPVVRRAISLAIDREGIVKALSGLAEPAFSVMHPNTTWAISCENYHYNPEKARELLSIAGWKPGSDGILEKDGKKFEVTIYTYPSRAVLKPMAEMIRHYLKEVGIKAEVKVIDYSAIKNYMTKNDLLLVSYYQTLIPDPDYYLRRVLSSNGSYNDFNYSNERVDELLELGLQTFDFNKRIELYTEVQRIACEDLPIVHIAFYKVPVVYRDHLRNVMTNPGIHEMYLYPGIETVRW